VGTGERIREASCAQRSDGKGRTEQRSGDHIQDDVLLDEERRQYDRRAPSQVDYLDERRSTDASPNVLEAKHREYGGGHMHWRAGVARGIHPLQHGESGVSGRVNARRRDVRGPEEKNDQTGCAQPSNPEPVRDQRAQVRLESRADANVQPQREIDEQRCGLERDDAIERSERYRPHRVLRVMEEVEIGNEEQADHHCRGEHL